MTHPVNRDWEDFAFVEFIDKYCGFLGNINGWPITEAGQHGQGMTYMEGESNASRVRVIRNGVEDPWDRHDICISNSVPSVVMQGNVMVMTLICDRSYAEDSWLESQPTLTTPPPNK
jgi:hypothetical protein